MIGKQTAANHLLTVEALISSPSIDPINFAASLQLQQVSVNVAAEPGVVAPQNVMIAPHQIGSRVIADTW